MPHRHDMLLSRVQPVESTCMRSMYAAMAHCAERSGKTRLFMNKRLMGNSAVFFYMPPKRKAPATSPRSSAKQITVTATEESEDSDDYSDPEEDVSQEEMERFQDESVSFDFESVRDAGRDRVASRTRYQYDLFIGLMAKFFTSDGEFASIIVAKTNLHFVSVQCPLPIKALNKYLDYVEAKQVPVRAYESESLPYQQLTKNVSVGYYSTVIQSLMDLYKCEQVLMSDETRLLLSSKRKTYSRKIAQAKAAGLYPTPPQRFITNDGYLDLCNSICTATPTAGCWADTLLSSLWAYIVLLWNLMARCDRVAQLLWSNMSWYKDSFTIFVPQSKTDQGGDRAFHKKLYCGEVPSVCPVLSCAILFFTRTDYRSVFVFPRADTRRSGLRQLGQLIAARYSIANFALFGCNPLHIAWHHFKRGAFTFLGALTDGPSWVGCKLRADQTVSDSSKPYLYQGSGQDGLIGRLLALLPYGDPELIPIKSDDVACNCAIDTELLEVIFLRLPGIEAATAMLPPETTCALIKVHTLPHVDEIGEIIRQGAGKRFDLPKRILVHAARPFRVIQSPGRFHMQAAGNCFKPLQTHSRIQRRLAKKRGTTPRCFTTVDLAYA